jgi:hypothetical protein
MTSMLTEVKPQVGPNEAELPEQDKAGKPKAVRVSAYVPSRLWQAATVQLPVPKVVPLMATR